MSCCCSAAAVIFIGANAAAQTTNGVIAGVVTDAQGGMLPGVTLTVRNAETGFTRTVVTEGDGRYRLAGLPPGRYDLRVELQGFGPVEVMEIILRTGSEVGRDITMQLPNLPQARHGQGGGVIGNRFHIVSGHLSAAFSSGEPLNVATHDAFEFAR